MLNGAQKLLWPTLFSACLFVVFACVIVNKSFIDDSVELKESVPMKRFWRSFWTPLTLKQGSLQNSNRMERGLSEDVKDPLRRFFGLQHFPGTSLRSADRMMQLHQVKHDQPYKLFFGLQPFPGTSLKEKGRTMELDEIDEEDGFRSKPISSPHDIILRTLTRNSAQLKQSNLKFTPTTESQPSGLRSRKSAASHHTRETMMYQVRSRSSLEIASRRRAARHCVGGELR